MWVTEYTFTMNDGKTGKRKRKTIYGKTRQEVKKKLEKLLVELNTDKYVDKNKTILADLAESIIEDGYRLNKLSDNSYLRKTNTLNQIKKHYIAFMEIQKIQEHDIRDFFEYITKYSNSVISKIYGLLNATFKKAIRKNIIKYNLLDNIDELPKPKSKRKDKDVRGFTIEEQKLFIDAINKDTSYKYHCQFLLSLYTGMRMGEINALNVKEDIDLTNKIIHVKHTLTRNTNDKTVMSNYTKTMHGIRDIIIDDQIEAILNEYLKNDFIENAENLLFYNPKNTFFSTSQVNSTFKRFCEHYNIAQGYNVNQHMLRHTFATRSIESGTPANVLSKIMGHANIKTTLEIYCDVFDNYEKKHTNKIYSYLEDNNLLLNTQKNDFINDSDFNEMLDNIKKLYEQKDQKILEILKLIT